MKRQLVEMVSRRYGRVLFELKKKSPEILLITGVAGVIGASVLACKATLKAEEVMTDHKIHLDMIKYAQEVGDDKYQPNDIKKDYITTYSATIIELLKLYGPAVVLMILSMGCIKGSHGIQKGRYISLVAAYKVLNEGFSMYRSRVVEDHGEETDYIYRHNLRKGSAEIEELQENGKIKKVKKDILLAPEYPSFYAMFYDESCKEWEKSWEMNLMTLKARESYWNQMLSVNGHVFLNDIRKDLGAEPTKAGQIVGWYVGKDAKQHGDNFIDFGLYNINNRDFINGLTNVALLDFNVQGPIYNLIGDDEPLSL